MPLSWSWSSQMNGLVSLVYEDGNVALIRRADQPEEHGGSNQNHHRQTQKNFIFPVPFVHAVLLLVKPVYPLHIKLDIMFRQQPEVHRSFVKGREIAGFHEWKARQAKWYVRNRIRKVFEGDFADWG
jgi:hypothetical protein